MDSSAKAHHVDILRQMTNIIAANTSFPSVREFGCPHLGTLRTEPECEDFACSTYLLGIFRLPIWL